MSKIKDNILNIKHVINNGLCIGCGVCRAVDPSITISLNQYGEYVAKINNSDFESDQLASEVCPFATNLDEAELADEVFAGLEQHEVIGRFSNLYAGYSVQDRESGSSGGIITYIVRQLLNSNQIDYAILARPRAADSNRGLEFSFDVISSEKEVTLAATSFYYPVTYSEVLEFIARNPGRYAITGIPCFHKGLRLLKRKNPVYRERIKFQLGLVCGQLKSALYFEYLLRRAGVPDGKIDSASFRRKDPDIRADEYYFEATVFKNNKQETYRISNRQIGVNWGMGLFKPKACDYCDDVFAETADIAVMDGWLPQYVNEGKGTSLVVVRDQHLLEVLNNGCATGNLHLEYISVDQIVKSQQGGINHRRKGLAYRLSLSSNEVPVKRIQSASDFPLLFKVEQLIRLVLRKISRRAMVLQIKAGSGLMIFNLIMAPLFITYRIVHKLKRIFKTAI